MTLNSDYKDILRIFQERKVKYILVGAYAMAAHGYPRSTMDIDLWVKPDPDNASLVLKALDDFGAPSGDLSQDDLLKEGIIFQIGVAPRRIDIITSVDGLKFDEAFSSAQEIEIDTLKVPVLSKPDLITNKRSTERLIDLADVETLER